MKFWTITFKEPLRNEIYVIYEGNDGRYYVGGSPSVNHPLLFQTRKRAEQALLRVKLVELNPEASRTLFSNGSFAVSRCIIQLL